MANYDSAAIIRAYAGTVKIIDGDRGVFDKSGNEITLAKSRIDAARTELDAEAAAIKYKTDRADNYASIPDQLDMQYWDAINGTTTWKDHIAKVKSDNPKPT